MKRKRSNFCTNSYTESLKEGNFTSKDFLSFSVVQRVVAESCVNLTSLSLGNSLWPCGNRNTSTSQLLAISTAIVLPKSIDECEHHIHEGCDVLNENGGWQPKGSSAAQLVEVAVADNGYWALKRYSVTISAGVSCKYANTLHSVLTVHRCEIFFLGCWRVFWVFLVLYECATTSRMMKKGIMRPRDGM